MIPGARRDRPDNKRCAATAGGVGGALFWSPWSPGYRGFAAAKAPDGKGRNCSVLQVRPVQQLLVLLQERKQLSSSPGARRGTAPLEGFAPLLPIPPVHLSCRCLTAQAGPRLPGGGAPPAQRETAERAGGCGGRVWEREKGGDTPAPSLAPRVSPLEQ